MKPILIAIAVIGLIIFCLPAVDAYNITLTKVPQEAKIGDVIALEGKIEGINTIAVYLFVTGPGLDNRGVTLDNLNIPTGKGLFTTAPVRLNDGSWKYVWATSIVASSMQPGKYSLFVVAAPIDRTRLHSSGEPYATATILFLPPPATIPTQSPGLMLTTLMTLALAGICGGALAKRKRS
jgi:hypothetical protein